MGDEAPPEEEPLLVGDTHRVWDDIEDGASAPAVTVQQLIASDPDHVIQFIAKNGVVKLGEFKVQDTLVLAAQDKNPFVVLGSDTRDIDVERVWRTHLDRVARRKQAVNTGWSRSVLVEAFVVNIKDAAAADTLGLVNPLLNRYNAGGCHYSVFGLPAVQAVLQFKWETFAGKMVRTEFACFISWLVAFSIFMLLFQDEDTSLSLPALLLTWRGIATLVAEVLSLAAMAPFLIIELGSVRAYAGGWLSLWNLLDVTTYSLQVAISVMHLARWHLDSGWLSVLVAFQCVLLWFRLNYFSRVMGGSTSLSIIDSMQQVVVDIRIYLLYLLLMMWGFACAYCVLFRRDQEHEQFSDIGHSMLTMFTYALGGADLDLMLGSSNPKASVVLSLLYQLAVATVLMSLLTGVMAQSLIKATAHEDLKRLLGKAQAIDELESTIPASIERLMPYSYPAFVHVLRIDPQAMDDTPGTDESDRLWHQQALVSGTAGVPLGAADEGSKGAGSSSGGGGGAGDVSVKALMAEVQGLRAQVQQLTDLLHTAVPSLPPSPDSSARMASL